MFFARNKKHFLMEKPLCNTEEECRSLIDTCKENGVVLMCAYPVPHYPAVRKIKELIDSGEYGKVMQVSVWTEQLTKLPDDDMQWGSTARLGGGQFFSHGCHYVDLLLRLLGKPVAAAHFGTRNGTPWLLKEGTSAVIMKFENGALAYHGATWGAKGTRLGWCLQVQTEKGMLEYTKRDGARIKLYNNLAAHIPGANKETSRYEIIWDGEQSHGNLKYTYLEIDHFADCVFSGKTPITDGETSLKSHGLIWELYNAEKNGYIADVSKYDIGDEARENYKAYMEKMNDL
jgi:predicted dehydrogenase